MYDVIVIGAGPSGIMAAIKAAEKSKVLIIEKNEKVLKKLEITGNGRCNLTNLKKNKEFLNNILSNKDKFEPILKGYNSKDIYNFFKEKTELKIENDDKVFPKSNKSQTIIKVLLEKLKENKVQLNLNETVLKIEKDKVITNKNQYKTKNIIIATGGKSYPKTGSTGDGYKFAKQLNLKVTKLYPSQTYLITEKKYNFQGITINVNLKYQNIKEEGTILFTHTGLSGPTIFKISEFVFKNIKKDKNIYIDFSNNKNIEKDLEQFDKKKLVITFIKKYLPTKIINYIFDIQLLNKKVATISKDEKEEIISNLTNYKIPIKETGSIEKSIVTGGGIDLEQINIKTLQSIKYPNIYFAGEVLDIHANTGGYNLTIAFSTGYLAGQTKK